MVSYNSQLRSILAGESKAYGFTIAFWGSGTMLVSVRDLPTIFEALSLGFGAVVGFGILALISFRGAFNPAEAQKSEYLVLSMIHYLAALTPILTSYLFALYIPGIWAFFVSGVFITLLYNTLMLVEVYLSEEIFQIEKRLESI